MGIEKGDLSLVHAQPFPDAVAEHETAVKNRHHRLGAWRHDAIDVDQDIVVTGISGEVMRTLSHGLQPFELLE